MRKYQLQCKLNMSIPWVPIHNDRYIHIKLRFGAHLCEVGGLARFVLGDFVHRVFGALLALAEGSPLLRYVNHLRKSVIRDTNKLRQ